VKIRQKEKNWLQRFFFFFFFRFFLVVFPKDWQKMPFYLLRWLFFLFFFISFGLLGCENSSGKK
jgi:hypothetical protein